MSTLLIKNIHQLVTCDDEDRVLHNADLYCEDGFIKAIGTALDISANEVIDGSHMLCYPGLVNTHHHLYQVFSRNLPQVQNMELFDWLKTLYEIWKNLDEDVIRLSSLTGMGELMKHGCTTCFDHHYVFPAHSGDLLGAQRSAARELGIRLYMSRGSMDLSVKDGGLPPDSVVQTVDEIMADSVRCIEKYHDDSYGAMCRVALAPCSPFSVSAELLRQSAILARQYHVRLHTHLCETKDEENFMLQREGIRPLEYMARLGWLGDDVWFAHGIHFNDEELRLLARTGTGVAHCPISNMKLASGVARIPEMLALGVPVGLAVDGSASNDGSSLLEELRVAFLLHRLHASRQAPTGYDILKMATRGSARLLGRDDIGQLSVGKCADLFMIDSRRLELVGCDQDAGSVLGTVGVRGPVDYTVVQGRVTVRQGLSDAQEKLESSEKEAKQNRRALNDAKEEAQAVQNMIQGHSLRMDSRRQKAEDAQAQKLDLRITHSLCISRQDADEEFKILTACGICQERLRYWGENVKVAVTNPENKIIFKTLAELSPCYWGEAFPKEEREEYDNR